MEEKKHPPRPWRLTSTRATVLSPTRPDRLRNSVQVGATRALAILSVFLIVSCGKSGGSSSEQNTPPLPPGILQPQDRTIGVFVALADPKHTGIDALPDSIGNGDNAETNLYWGNDEGLKGVFDRSKKWKLVDKMETPQRDCDP